MKILLDTTYLLPFLSIPINIGVSSQVFNNQLKKIMNLYSNNLYITTVSIIECQWKAINLYKKMNNPQFLTQAQLALPLLSNGKFFPIINPWEDEKILKYANELLQDGHSDYMDCLIFSTARKHNFQIVSEETKLKRLLLTLSSWKSLKIYNWLSFIKHAKI